MRVLACYPPRLWIRNDNNVGRSRLREPALSEPERNEGTSNGSDGAKLDGIAVLPVFRAPHLSIKAPRIMRRSTVEERRFSAALGQEDSGL